MSLHQAMASLRRIFCMIFREYPYKQKAWSFLLTSTICNINKRLETVVSWTSQANIEVLSVTAYEFGHGSFTEFSEFREGHLDEPYSNMAETRRGKCIEEACHLKTQRAGNGDTEPMVNLAESWVTYLQAKGHKAVTANNKDVFPPTGFQASMAIGHKDLNF